MPSDRRHAHRYRSLENRQNAVLKVGDESIPALLVDESAGGFALHIDAHPGVYEGEFVWLQANGCWIKTRVGRIRHLDSGVEVGLSRLADQGVEETVAAEPQRKSWFRFWRMPQAHRVPVIIAVAVLLAIGLVTGLKLWQAQSEKPPVGVNEAALKVQPHEDLQESIRKMGASVFLDPDVGKLLRLTKRQRQQVEAIVARSQRAAAMARKQPGVTARDLRRIQLRAQEDARHVLSGKQKALWDHWMRLVEQRDAAID